MVKGQILAVFDEENDFLWHEDEWDTEKNILLGYMRKSSGQNAADAVS